VAQNQRREPYGLRVEVEAEILNLQKQGIIELVEDPTLWVSPLVINCTKALRGGAIMG